MYISRFEMHILTAEICILTREMKPDTRGKHFPGTDGYRKYHTGHLRKPHMRGQQV